jgi:hypothetical protein
MYSSTYLNWFRRLLILGAVVAGLAASAAGAGIDSRPPDVSDVASGLFATQATIVSRPPDVQDAADVQAAAAALHTMVAGPEAAGLQGIARTWEHQLHSPATSSQYPTPAGLKADGLRYQGIAPTWEQAMAQHPTPALSPGDRIDLIVSTWEQAIAQHTTPALSPGDRINLIVSQERGQAQSTLVSRPPDVSDAAQVAASVSTVPGNGFAWDDWAIGVGTGLGLALLLGGGIMVGRQQRHRVQPA